MTGDGGDWASVADLLDMNCPALPDTRQALDKLIERQGWRNDPLRARFERGRGSGGGTWYYHFSLWPAETQARHQARRARSEETDRRQGTSELLWARFERLPDAAREKARKRLDIVRQVHDLRAGGMEAGPAVALAAQQASVSPSTLWNWLRLVEGLPGSDWWPALAPRHAGRTATADCDPRAWEFVKADYLRPEQPSFTACFRRLAEAADEHGWSPLPSEKTLRRRLQREVPRGARTLARNGRDVASHVFPHQTRDRGVYRAMEAVNADGHTFDVFVRWPDGKIARPVMVAVQDLYSGMILGHRLATSESWTAVRHAFGDMIESFGIPEHAYLDNGRAFASKWMTGRSKTRFRFKIRDDEPEGLLTGLSVQVHWTTPYHGQAKPIERAFRDLCEEIAKHPACAGAYTGNSPAAKPANYASRAVALEDFRQLVAEQIRRHNVRPGRRSAAAAGRSFHDIFTESVESAGWLVKHATRAQRQMFMLAAEGVTCRKPTGEIQLAGNRYWDERLVEAIGQRVVVRFDPDDLLLPAYVYTRDGRLIAEAACIEASGFNDVDAARAWAQAKRDWLKKQRECLAIERSMKIEDVARLLRAQPAAERPEPKVVRAMFGSAAPGADAVDEERAADSFGRAIRAASGDAGIFAFPDEAGRRLAGRRPETKD